MTALHRGDKIAEGLAQFTGSEHWYRHGLNPSVTYTDGAKYLADECGAYWLLDAIVANQLLPEVRREEFQLWTLKVDRDTGHATLTCDDGNGNIVFKHRIDYTDFPLASAKLYFVNKVIHLPSEY